MQIIQLYHILHSLNRSSVHESYMRLRINFVDLVEVLVECWLNSTYIPLIIYYRDQLPLIRLRVEHPSADRDGTSTATARRLGPYKIVLNTHVGMSTEAIQTFLTITIAALRYSSFEVFRTNKPKRTYDLDR